LDDISSGTFSALLRPAAEVKADNEGRARED
jgi:hypothetical protein